MDLLNKIILFVLILNFSAIAKSTNNREYIFAGGGLAVPISSAFSDIWENGIHAGVGYGIPLSSKLNLLLNINFNLFSMERKKYLELIATNKTPSISGGEAYLISSIADLKYKITFLGPKLIPYIKGGSGIVIISIQEVATTPVKISNPITGEYSNVTFDAIGTEQTVLALSAGIGFDFFVGEKTTLFLDLAYLVGFTNKKYFVDLIDKTENTSIITLKIGISLS